MPTIKRVKTAYLFPNAMLVVCNAVGHQINELQGSYSIALHKRILLEAMDDCEFKGFEVLPKSFTDAALEYAKHWRSKNLNHEEIENL